MPEVTIQIGGRDFAVACNEGEERYLRSAAAMLDNEATTLGQQMGRMPENQMLLMAGLMLADRTAGMEERLRLSEEKLAAREARIDELENRAPPAAERIEVPILPQAALEAMDELAARAEALAGRMNDAAASAEAETGPNAGTAPV